MNNTDQPSDKTIAVLPFANRSASGEIEYFSDGMTVGVINAMAKIEGLIVTSKNFSIGIQSPKTGKIGQPNNSSINETGQKRALLDEASTAETRAKLQDLIEREKPHLNPDLTLRTLANQLGIHANQLSWLLNDSLGKNFNTFINHYRVEEFKATAHLPENSHLTILSVAYDCGFNSKSVFNSCFKKEMGMTPKEFLKQ